MATQSAQQDIPNSVLDQALHWAVVMGSGTAGDSERHSLEQWLAADPAHARAWQRLQAIDQEFTRARAAGAPGNHALQRVAERRRRRVLLNAGGLLSVTLLLAVTMVFFPAGHHYRADYATGPTQQAIVDLPGGARVHLSSRTALDVHREAGNVLLKLHHGKVLIDSSPAAKPAVRTDHALFTPIGTRFVITDTETGSDVVVSEGRVAITPHSGAAPSIAAPGTGWRVTTAGAEALPATGLTPGAWTDGIVEADNARLADVLDALAAYRKGWLHYDTQAGELRVSGVFRLDDTDSALRALARSLPIQVERTTDWWIKVTTAQPQ